MRRSSNSSAIRANSAVTQPANRPLRPIVLPVLCAAVLLLSGCATLNPKPWDKDLMAKKVMQVGANAPVTAAEGHIYFSKEASSGGRNAAGGGCGCN